MSSKTFKDNKKIPFSITAIQEEIRFGHVLSKEERKEKAIAEKKAIEKKAIDGYYKLASELDGLIEKVKANPMNDSIKESIVEKRAEIESYLKANPEAQAHLRWQEEQRRKASLKRQAEAIVAKRRNEEPIELLRKQQAEKRARDQAIQPKKPNHNMVSADGLTSKQRALNKAIEEKARKEGVRPMVKEVKESVEDLVAKLNRTIGGYGFN